MTITPILRSIAAGLLAITLVAVTGCANRGAPPLDVTLTKVALTDVQLLEQRFQLTLRFSNRTDRDVAVDGMRFTLDLNGREFARGVSNQTFNVPRFAEVTVDVAASSSLSSVLQQVGELQARAQTSATGTPPVFTYRISGRASTGYSGINFDTQSELPLPTGAR
ncbi:MAG: LEA type 2 family protein [Betaproteobacteria bacterium]